MSLVFGFVKSQQKIKPGDKTNFGSLQMSSIDVFKFDDF